MSESNVMRPSRKVAIADHLWDAFANMADQMGADRDGLINQAMFTFARLNGFLNATEAMARVAAPAPVAEAPRAASPRMTPAPQPSEDTPVPGPAPVAAAPARRATGPATTPNPVRAPARPAPEPEPEPEPMEAEPDEQDEQDADLPADPSDENIREASGEEDPELFDQHPESAMDNDPDRKAVAERVLETAAELERLIKGKQSSGETSLPESNGLDSSPSQTGDGPALYVMAEDGELDKIVKERFIIGRGKHCDLIINSGKVSREHAAIVRDGEEYFIEDLGSSNGTWFNKQRIKRRKIEDGDEFFICSEKVKCVVR